ncbi:hypothetical protein EVAR_63198_1 [Eumeta japonica]|uniref:Uncharacterized protein n=1 Tax=Eumeta variegata TaxID=151549 RepID=A0A4C1ZI76_EUMVA|nr:hypothetical protein EVAR_63198_1 [Eumeta japonica]
MRKGSGTYSCFGSELGQLYGRRRLNIIFTHTKLDVCSKLSSLRWRSAGRSLDDLITDALTMPVTDG